MDIMAAISLILKLLLTVFTAIGEEKLAGTVQGIIDKIPADAPEAE